MEKHLSKAGLIPTITTSVGSKKNNTIRTPTFYDENNISTKHNKTNVRIKQQKQTLLINQKSQDLPVLKIPPIRNGKKREKMIKRQKFPSASV
jgi:hypothetical protein